MLRIVTLPAKSFFAAHLTFRLPHLQSFCRVATTLRFLNHELDDVVSCSEICGDSALVTAESPNSVA